MIYTKFEGNQPAGFGVDFKGFLAYIGMVAILVIWRRFEQKLYSFNL